MLEGAARGVNSLVLSAGRTQRTSITSVSSQGESAMQENGGMLNYFSILGLLKATVKLGVANVETSSSRCNDT